MSQAGKYPSKKAAVQTLERFFAQTPKADSLGLPELFAAAGRSGKPGRANLAWLSNKLVGLRYHDLVSANYSYAGRRRLQSLSLTMDGKRALGRLTEVSLDNNSGASGPAAAAPNLNDALAAVSQLIKDYPEFDISLTIKPKTS